MQPRLLLCYFLGLIAFGIAHIALLPPFEGFDENAHYDRIREIAAVGSVTPYGESFLSTQMEDYQGPKNYGGGKPPFAPEISYPSFAADKVQQAAFTAQYREGNPFSVPFTAGSKLNWQAQHPPLYYLLMAPLLKLTEPLGFLSQLFWMRVFSYGLAVAGVALTFLALRAAPSAEMRQAGYTGMVLYPIMLPMFFPEFARLGNDSLCLLLSAAAFYCFLRMLYQPRRRWAVGLGVALGIGCLTKAFFLPIIGAVAVFLLIRLWQAEDGTEKRQLLRHGLWAGVVAALIGGGWYAYQHLIHGQMSGTQDAIELAKQGGIRFALAGFDGMKSAYAVVVSVTTWIWAGSWSLTRIHPLFYLPLLAMLGWLGRHYAIALCHHKLREPLWLPLWLYGFFAAGMLWHILISVPLKGHGNTPGWYLHILFPWVVIALGTAAARIRSRFWTWLVGYGVLFHLGVLWAQVSLFAGCAVKGDDKYYHFPNNAFCLDRIGAVFTDIGVLGYPTAGFFALVVASICTAPFIRRNAA